MIVRFERLIDPTGKIDPNLLERLNEILQQLGVNCGIVQKFASDPNSAVVATVQGESGYYISGTSIFFCIANADNSNVWRKVELT